MKKRIMKNQGGFTLVELIVVLVILAILAAILVPALLGYIDKARNGQYLEEAHSIYTAIQVVEDELYAKGTAAVNGGTDIVTAHKTEIDGMIDPTKIISAKVNCNSDGSTGVKEEYSVKKLVLKFTSQNAGKTVEITFENGSWTDPSVS